MKAKKALVLSGGGIKGAFQAGFCNYLAQIRWKPDFIVGASVGALNGAFLCQTDDFLENSERAIKIWKHYSHNHFFYELNKQFILKLGWSESLFSNKHFYSILNTRLKAKNFHDLSIPLYVNTTEYESGDAVMFSEGKLIPPLVASYSTPPLFPPVHINGVKYIEGTINNKSMINEAKLFGAKKIVYLDVLNSSLSVRNSNIISEICYLANLVSREINKKELPFLDKAIAVAPDLSIPDDYERIKRLSFISRLIYEYKRVTGENTLRMIEYYIEQGRWYAAMLHKKGKIRV